jgi:hypothetical protein
MSWSEHACFKPTAGADDAGVVIETLIVLAGSVLLVAGALVAQLVPAEWVVQAGWACTAVGLLLGVPTGFWYHVKLRRCLRRAGDLPAGWWLRPVAHHGRLGPEEQSGVLVWFFAGGVGFGLSMVGCVGVGAGVLLQAWRAGVF